MKKTIKVFEPITKQQIKSLHFQAGRCCFSEDDVYREIEALIGIRSVTALSKNEAAFLIRKMYSRQIWMPTPIPPPFEHEIEGGANLPSYYHVRDIRLMFKTMAWDKTMIKSWLKKWIKVDNFMAMDRKKAQTARYVLMRILERHSGAAKVSNVIS